MFLALDAAFPSLAGIFSGRQSARTVHFIVAVVLVAFVLVHILMVILSGVFNNMRSMITGWYVIRAEDAVVLGTPTGAAFSSVAPLSWAVCLWGDANSRATPPCSEF